MSPCRLASLGSGSDGASDLYRESVTGIDVDAARALTPGSERVLHLNHAGASLLPQPVLDAVVGHLRLESQIGGYEAAAAAAPSLERTYGAVAALLGCDVDEVALTDSATRGWASAVYSLPLSSSDRVITTRAEYGSNAIALLQLQRRTGCEIALVEDDEQGQLDLDALDAVVRASVHYVTTDEELDRASELIGKIAHSRA